jgi:class 3 adenylate cyclase
MSHQGQTKEVLSTPAFQRVEIREMEAIRQWLSVNAARNVLLLTTGLKLLGLSSSLIKELLPDRLKAKTVKQMQEDEDSLTLSEYDALVQGMLTQELGHVSKLSQIGEASPDINFGFDRTLRRLAKSKVLGWLFAYMVSPWAILEKLNEAAAAWNTNKSWHAYRTGQCSARLVCVYNPGGPQNKTVNRLQDATSLLHLIRGMNRALPTFFKGRSMATVHYRIVELPIVPLLRMWAPELDVRWNGTELLIGEKVVGRLVWLKPGENGMLNGDYTYSRNGEVEHNGEVRGIRLDCDILTTNKMQRTGEESMLPIVFAGEIFQIDDHLSPFGRTVLEMEWEETTGDRLSRRLPWLNRLATGADFEKTFKHERLDMGRRMHAATVAHEAATVNAIARTVFPTNSFWDDVKRGRDPILVEPDIVTVCVDIIGFSQWTNGKTMEEWVDVGKFVRAFANSMVRIVLHHGGRYANYSGDGLYFCWRTDGRSPDPDEGVEQRLVRAVNASLDIVSLAEEVHRPVRIGIALGPAVTFTFVTDDANIPAMPATVGRPMNFAARAETALKQFNEGLGSCIGLDATSISDPNALPGNQRQYTLKFMGEVEVKGDAFPLWRVTRLDEDSKGLVRSVAESMAQHMQQLDTTWKNGGEE